jgi:hypothetical protein
VQDIPDAKFNWLVNKYAGTKAPVNGSTESIAVSWTNSNTFFGYLNFKIRISLIIKIYSGNLLLIALILAS